MENIVGVKAVVAHSDEDKHPKKRRSSLRVHYTVNDPLRPSLSLSRSHQLGSTVQ